MSEPRGTLPHLLIHHCERGLPSAETRIPPVDRVTSADESNARRVVDAYRKAVRDERAVSQRPSLDVWEAVRNAFHGEFIRLMHNGDPYELASALNQCFRLPITHGLGPGRAVYEASLTPEGNKGIAALTVDKLAAVAEFLGILPFENPEQGRWGENIYLDPLLVVERIEKEIGFPVCPPNTCGSFGVSIRDRVLFPRNCEHLYVACRIRQLISSGTTVAEIGGGYGGVAYYCWLSGIRRYRIYDLPLINAIQGYYLLSTLSDARICLYGELPTEPAVCVLPYWEFEKQTRSSFGFVLNQDSLPEIDPSIAKAYLRHIAAENNCYFLSINQEGGAPSGRPDLPQSLVPELIRDVGKLIRLSRHPYWLRKGYVEELYRSAAEQVRSD